VLITEAATIVGLTQRDIRLRCADCGEMHLLSLDDYCDDPAIVGATAKS
jgi:hypothetical protein